VTERERVIRLNGIGGVTFQKTRIENTDPGFSLNRSSVKAGNGLLQPT
jgi:hypothetical protein